ncbi:helicase HerA-like domain-containing protein [Mumia qirimensis]|uniref:helicase HerA-like domain-containing protein n=1 Tax=Mumia qirimensis TaxID=3234852 RepID=UPI00351D2F10
MGDDADDARKAAEEAERALREAQARADDARRRADELEATEREATEREAGAAAADGETQSELARTVAAAYAFEGAALQIGALVEDGEARPAAQVRIPLAMLNRHGLVAGATGTGKTKTLQVLAEQIAGHGVPVFAADIKGDLSGIAVPGSPSEALTARCVSIGQEWTPTGSRTEFFSLGGVGTGVPIRATVAELGPTLLAKVLGLNETQESSLGLVFHYARKRDLALIRIEDLRAVVQHLTSAEGKADLAELGGLSKATAGVILRELIAFADAGADSFFGEPSIAVSDFLRVADDGTGIVSLLEVPSVADQPELFSTFLMYLLTRLFSELPEVGDTDKPKLVFVFDEAHLLFKDASDDFLDTVVQTVRLIRSRGVGVFFVTQTPKDVPGDVLAQLGSRIQHQLRAHTPADAKALRATVSTYPTSSYDLGEVLTSLATGEAVVTVMNERGAPSPVAWTRVRAPQGSMEPMPSDAMAAAAQGSPLQARYGTAAAADRGAASVLEQRKAGQATEPSAAGGEERRGQSGEVYPEGWDEQPDPKPKRRSGSGSRSTRMSPLDRAMGEAGRTFAREITKRIFGRR